METKVLNSINEKRSRCYSVYHIIYLPPYSEDFPKLVFWKTWIQIMRKIGICAFLRISQQVVLDSVMFKFYILRWKSFQEMFNLPRSLTITKESFFSHYFNDFSFCYFLKLAYGYFSWWLFFSTKICQYTWDEKTWHFVNWIHLSIIHY